MNLICVHPGDVPRVWPFVSGLIKKAMEKGDLGAFRPVERKVESGDMLLWVVCTERSIEAAVVTEIALTELHKVCTIVACGGKDMDEWLPLIGDIERYAKLERCHAMRIYGRAGWRRKLPQYRPRRVILERAL